MRKLLTAILLLLVTSAFAQVETTISIPTTSAASPTFQSLLYLPSDYSTTTTNYVLLMFFHGSGESCPPLSNIFNSTTAGGPCYFIEHSGWPVDGGFINPRDGLKYKFIVVSPQSGCNGWSSAGDQADWMVHYMVTHYRIDVNRIYLTGLSSGGGTCIEYTAHMVNDGNETNLTATRHHEAAAQVPMSFATITPLTTWAQIINLHTKTWGLGDQIGDTYGENTWNMCKSGGYLNTNLAGSSWFTGNPGSNGLSVFNTGHGPWNTYFNPNYRENFTFGGITASMNIYEWMLTNTLVVVTTPTANAGSNQTLTQPTSSTTLTGTGTAGSGHTISGYGWTQTSGPVSTITTPASAATTVTGLTALGSYVYRLTVTDNIGQTANSSVTITVQSPVGVVAVVTPSSQSITQPATSVTFSGASSTGTISSYAWTQVSGPNTASIAGQTAVVATMSNLIPGSYTFRLSVNGGTSTATATVVVNPGSPYPPCGTHRRIRLIPAIPGDTGVFVGASQANVLYQPGDTLELFGYYNYVEIDGFQGNPLCPLVIINAPGQQAYLKRQIKLDGCTYVHITGTGDAGFLRGIKIEYDPQLRYQSYHAIEVRDRSKCIEIDHIYAHNVDMGIVCEGLQACDTTQNFPNWIVDSILIHDNVIIGTWNEGMYLGNTAPDNAGNDLRPVVCGVDTFYYPPAKNGYTKVWNNIVDSTGRGGIQLSNAQYGMSEIYNNVVKHSGLNGDDAQGAAITLGLYTKVYIHNNVISNTYTWGIASIGACGTNSPIRIEANTIDSSGYLLAYNLATTNRPVYDPRTEPTTAIQLTWPQTIEIDTRTRQYINATPHAGTAIPGQDSTEFWIKGNTIGLKKSGVAINIDDDFPGIQHTGNVICSNINNDGTGSPAVIATAPGIVYSTTCTNIAPSVNAGPNQAITAPISSTTLIGTATAFGTTIRSYLWTQTSGPSAVIAAPSSASTTVTGLIPAIYVFTLTVTDNNNLSSSAQVTVQVFAAGATQFIPHVKLRHRKYILK